MLNGLHLVLSPIMFSFFIPLALVLYRLMFDSLYDFDFYHYFLIVIAAILILTNIIYLTLVFTRPKENTKKLKNALRSKELLKWSVTISVVAISVSVIGQTAIPEYPNLVSNDLKTIYDLEIFRIVLFFSLYSFVFSLAALLPVIMRSNYFRGKSFAEFQIGLDEKDSEEKIWSYQNGLLSYEKFLIEKFGIKLKHFDKIQSYLISEQSQLLDNKIKDLLNTFDKTLEPAQKLNSWIYISDAEIPRKKITSEIFKSNRPYENLEKRFKILLTGVGITVVIYLHFNPL